MSEVTCETQGHLWGSGGFCIMCKTPKPAEPVPSKKVMHQAAEMLEALIDGGCDHSVGICWCAEKGVIEQLRTYSADEPCERPANVPAGEPVWLPKITPELYEQFDGTGLIESEPRWNWSQAAVDLACVFKAQLGAAQPPGRDAEDAARYRWMRTHYLSFEFSQPNGPHRILRVCDPLDERIDSYRASETKSCEHANVRASSDQRHYCVDCGADL